MASAQRQAPMGATLGRGGLRGAAVILNPKGSTLELSGVLTHTQSLTCSLTYTLTHTRTHTNTPGLATASEFPIWGYHILASRKDDGGGGGGGCTRGHNHIVKISYYYNKAIIMGGAVARRQRWPRRED